MNCLNSHFCFENLNRISLSIRNIIDRKKIADDWNEIDFRSSCEEANKKKKREIILNCFGDLIFSL